MRMHPAVLACAALLVACEAGSPPSISMSAPGPASFLLAAPDAAFRLSAEQRSTLPAPVDADALEALLARIRPEHRGSLLRDLTELGARGPVAFGPLSTAVSDPGFQAALARVFRPPPVSPSSP